VGVEGDVGTIVGVNVGVGTTVWLAVVLTMEVLAGNNIEEGDLGEQADIKTISRIRIRKKLCRSLINLYSG
jgi:hypothetical protein